MSLLTPDSGLLFWMIVSFGIVFVILSKYGFPVIVKAIEQRKAYIDNSLETARQANERLAHIQAEGEKMLAEAKEKQNAVLKEAFAEAAKGQDRTGAQLLRDFMREYVKEQREAAEYDAWFRREAQIGIDQANAGMLIPGEEVEAEAALWREEARRKLADRA